MNGTTRCHTMRATSHTTVVKIAELDHCYCCENAGGSDCCPRRLRGPMNDYIAAGFFGAFAFFTYLSSHATQRPH
jgi:hypothetical protein